MLNQDLTQITKLIRYYILKMSTIAGSGHPTSSLSGVELITSLFFGGFYQSDLKDPKNSNNDRLIFSKGHASPLFYSLYLAANELSETELLQFRQFDSNLEGHPTPRFKHTEATTGSLGQGLGIGVGMALNSKLRIKTEKTKNLEVKTEPEVEKNFFNKILDLGKNLQSQFKKADSKAKIRDYRTWVLLGDSELAEGSIWEALNSASYYKLDNLVAIVDLNRLGQTGETQIGWDTENLKNKVEAFGWRVFVIDGHDLTQINQTLEQIVASHDDLLDDTEASEEKINQTKTDPKPTMIIAKTVKGKGISFLENKPGFHGKALNQEDCDKAILELGEMNLQIRGQVNTI